MTIPKIGRLYTHSSRFFARNAKVWSDSSYAQRNYIQPKKRNLGGIFEILGGPDFDRSIKGLSLQSFFTIFFQEFNGAVYFFNKGVHFQAIPKSGGIRCPLYMHVI